MTRPSETTKAARRERREEAADRIGEIEALAANVRVRDAGHVHITVWTIGGLRIEWWPGTGKWTGNRTIKQGGFDAFKQWLLDDPDPVRTTPGAVEINLIDEGDAA